VCRLAVALLTLTILAAPLDARAQVGTMPRVGLVSTTSPISSMVGPEASAPFRAFFEALRATLGLLAAPLATGAQAAKASRIRV
jgi:hypothetical protein